jgi:putative spermidine/putrescine transport system substrate-binding protein
MAGIAVVAIAFQLPSMALAQSGQVVVATGGGTLEDAYRKVLFGPFTEKTGAEVVTTANEAARLKAMVEQGSTEWDLVQGPAEALVVWGREGLLEPIDYSCMDRENIVPEAMSEHFVMTDLAAYNVAWNTENVTSDPPENWQELWAHDGRISLFQQPYQTLEAALIADGVAPDQLYPLDVDRAFASLEKVKERLVWWSSGAESAQLLLDGEVDAGATWNGRVHLPKMEGAPVDYSFGQAVLVSDGWGVPKGAPNRDLANQMICMLMSPEVQADFAEAIPYGPTNRAAVELIPDEVKANLPSAGPDNVILDVNYWADHGPEIVERFNAWLLQ